MVVFERATLYSVSRKGAYEETGELRLLNVLNAFKDRDKRTYIGWVDR